MDFLAWFYWDPPREIFRIPFLNHPVVFYGVWFVAGFIAGYFITIRLFQQQLANTKNAKEAAFYLTERLTWYVILGTIIGARLGHVFFYDWPIYQDHPLDIFKVWQGGLASHGGIVGVMVGVWLYRRSIAAQFPQLTYITLFDILVIPSGLVACCIRMGNFFNQEILGPVTNVPWAVIFGHPIDGTPGVPRHPVQLYEAIAYFAIFCLMITLWKKRPGQWRPGFMSGLFFILLFAARFALEFIKEPQSLVMDESFVQMGQLLSIPFILLGFVLFRYGSNINKLTLKMQK